MSKLSKILENKKEIGFCSCVIKVQGKNENENKNNNKKQKSKTWLDYFNDIVSEDLKVLIKNENNLKVNKYLNLEKNIELSKLMTYQNLNVLLDNPFDFNLEKIFQNKKKNTNLKIKRSISSCESKKKKSTTSFDDLIWNNKLKKYINLNDLQLLHNVQSDSKNKRNKSCLSSFNHKANFEKEFCEIHRQQIHINQNRLNSLQLKKPTNGNKNQNGGSNSFFLMKNNANKNNFIKKNQINEFDNNINLNISQLYDINEIEQKIKNEILAESEKIKYVTIKQNHNKFFLIQDEKSGRNKIVASQKIDIGEVIFIESQFLETSILFNDLWDTFNNLDNEQKRNLDEISEFMNIERIYKRKNSENSLKHKCDIHNNNNFYLYEEGINNLKNENHNKYYYRKNDIIYKEHNENVVQNNILNSNTHENDNMEFFNDNFINKLIKFEIFTDILKNSFISCNNRTKVMLFKNASFLNHNCFPNASYCFIDKNKICLLAVKTINMYDEIRISYINELYSSIEYRKSKLKDMKNMNCCCNRCLQIMDEERNILCAVCKYSYVSKKLNEQYIKIMEEEKENLTKSRNISTFEHVEESEMTNKKLNNFTFNINNELNNSKYLNKNYYIKNMIEKSVNDHTLMNKGVVINERKDSTHNYIIYENLNDINEYHKKSNDCIEGYENINDNTNTNDYERIKNYKFTSSEPYHHLNKGLNKLQEFQNYKNIADNKVESKTSDERNIENFLNDDSTGIFFYSQFNDNTNEMKFYTRKNSEVKEEKNCRKIFNCLNSTFSSKNNFKNPLYPSMEKENSYDQIKSESYLINKGINEKLVDISVLEKNENLDTNLVNILSINYVREKIGYCKFHNSGKWVCDTCNDTISNYAMPLDSESCFIQEYKIIKEKINSNKFDIESIVNNVERSLLYIVGILGEKHWLYASFNYIIADLCFSLYNFNSLNKKYLLKSFNSFYNFLNFIQMKCPQAVHTDLVPLALKFLIICIYTSNYKIFYKFVKSGFLELIKQKYGSWDISYISLLYCFKICSEKINNSILVNRKIILMLAEFAKINMLRNHFN
ncbi:SET domain protein, putative [Plasmodium gallinaceum]|uniref:SET domain protein, putative n=1 Tax=Plasmodium gallinaceum TaxID=5849 RepID=A0A1J1GVS2_PLAGA|nr:SET domain protein, putative [Plasmodium gallinaceum]CRG96648.1 SET domain protein, putative [Plasmodium gallinaceum]